MPADRLAAARADRRSGSRAAKAIPFLRAVVKPVPSGSRQSAETRGRTAAARGRHRNGNVGDRRKGRVIRGNFGEASNHGTI